MRLLSSHPSPQVDVRPGQYLCSTRSLYHIERVVDGRALVEDCRSGDLVEVPLSQLRGLTRVGASVESRA